MANLSQTAANVAVSSATTRVKVVQYGEAVTQGQPLYLENGKYWRADSNVQAKSRATAIAMTPGGVDGFGVVAEGAGGRVNLGATLVVGETYVVSATVGAICPIADLTTGDYPCILGTAISTSVLETAFLYSGAVKP